MPVTTRTDLLPDGSTSFEVELYNDLLSVDLLNLGATLRDVKPSDGSFTSLCLGLGSAADYVSTGHYFGVTAGPVANRIGGAAFELDGTRFQLEANEDDNQLHGGPTGFSHKLWDAEVEQNPDRVRFSLHRPDGEGGYPGNLDVTVTYELIGNQLRYEWSAATDRPTPVSLTNHAYWNLGGSGNILDHTLFVAATALVAVNTTNIPTGELPTVTDSNFDLQTPVNLGGAIETIGEGIDHCYVLDPRASSPDPQPQVILSHPESGRRLEMMTTLPGVQVYTGQFLDGSPEAGGFHKHAGVCLETQHLPDAVNQPAFPSCLVQPGQPVTHVTDYVFHL